MAFDKYADEQDKGVTRILDEDKHLRKQLLDKMFPGALNCQRALRSLPYDRLQMLAKWFPYYGKDNVDEGADVPVFETLEKLIQDVYSPQWNQLTTSVEVKTGPDTWEQVDPGRFYVRLRMERRFYNQLGKIRQPNQMDSQNYLTELAMTNSYHPLTNLMEDCIKRGKQGDLPRLEIGDVVTEYLDKDAPDIVKLVFAKWWCGAVQRALRPGTRQDLVPIIYGTQGGGKSRFCEAISGGYHANDISFPPKADGIRACHRAFIIELGEICFANRDIDLIKRAVTTHTDFLNLKYIREIVVMPRAFSFIGTTNNPALLRDSTGNRRFLPIDMGYQRNTREQIEHLTSQFPALVWAAYRQLQGGLDTVLNPDEIQDLERYSQRFYDDDPGTEAVLSWAVNELESKGEEAVITTPRAIERAYSGFPDPFALRDARMSDKWKIDKIFLRARWVRGVVNDRIDQWRPEGYHPRDIPKVVARERKLWHLKKPAS